MSVRYIRVNPVSNLFAPAVRAFGNIAIVGTATSGPTDTASDPITSPGQAAEIFGESGDLINAIEACFSQTPGPTLVYGVRAGEATPTGVAAALTAAAALNAQFVVIANTPLTQESGAVGDPGGQITQLAEHVVQVSDTGGDGMERMGVAMLARGEVDTDVVTGALAHERMIYIAHRSTDDAAAAVAGTIAGYEPHISPLLKQVNISSAPFTPSEITQINGAETFGAGPAGNGVNWLSDPLLIPGGAVYLGEAYTGNPGGRKFVDEVRATDHMSYLVKARLIRAIGNVRISRSGLRALRTEIAAVLTPLVNDEVIEDFDIIIPILTLLDKDPDSLTTLELAAINNAQAERLVEVLIAVDYAGAIHRLDITLRFE